MGRRTKAGKAIMAGILGALAVTGAAAGEASTPQAQYDESFGALLRGNNAAAESGFRRFIQRYPRHALAPEASHWIGEMALARRDNAGAIRAFSDTVARYPSSPRAPESWFRLGVAQARIGQRGQACQTFGQLLVRYPRAEASLLQRANVEARRTGC